jgi:hypothetical protein
MAQSVVYTDDIDGSANAEPVRFGCDGVSYVIDLGEKNAKKLRDFLAPFIAAAEVERAATPESRTRSKSEGAYGFKPAQVRKWWRANEKAAGEEFVAKGRVPQTVVDKWTAAGRP